MKSEEWIVLDWYRGILRHQGEVGGSDVKTVSQSACCLSQLLDYITEWVDAPCVLGDHRSNPMINTNLVERGGKEPPCAL